MTAPKRDNRRFQAGRAIVGRKGSTYKCHCCGRMTRETGLDESSLDLCAYCLEESYLENSLSDGNIEQPQFEVDLDKLQKTYKRGQYAQNEADKKVGKIQSSRYQAAGDALAVALEPLNDKAMLSVKVGRGIEQVMQLDDVGVRREFGLGIMAQTKITITLVATRKDLINFRNACADRISSQYDQPLWYMSSAKATVAKIDGALKEAK